MANPILDKVTGPFSSLFGSIGTIAQIMMLGFVTMLIAGGLLYLYVNSKKWNLRIEFKLTRSDGRIVNAEWGKGYYNTKKGYVLLKRPKVKGAIEMKPFDPKIYVYGDNIVTVTQIGPNTWAPVHPDSFAQFENEKGKTEYFINLKSDLTDQLQWADNFKKRSKEVYSIMNFLERYQVPISIAIVVLAQAISTAFIIAIVK